jgi:hypothetical protein
MMPRVRMGEETVTSSSYDPAHRRRRGVLSGRAAC